MARPSAAKQSPMRGITASTHSDSGEVARPSAQTTARMARPERKLLLVVHASSASTTSSSCSGAFMMASQVRCTCMREKAEYSDSKVALLAVEKHTVPAARKAM